MEKINYRKQLEQMHKCIMEAELKLDFPERETSDITEAVVLEFKGVPEAEMGIEPGPKPALYLAYVVAPDAPVELRRELGLFKYKFMEAMETKLQLVKEPLFVWETRWEDIVNEYVWEIVIRLK